MLMIQNLSSSLENEVRLLVLILFREVRNLVRSLLPKNLITLVSNKKMCREMLRHNSAAPIPIPLDEPR